jgi:hypothetical protein
MLYKGYFLSFLVFIYFTSYGQHLYMGKYKRAGINESIEIKSDSTLEYIMKSGNNKSCSNGKWIKGKDNVLLLKSEFSKDGFPFM